MIVLEEGDGLLLITQGDHAHLAAELLALCRFPELLEHPRRQQLLEATREHDNGWRESDAAPMLDAESGRPHSYLTLPEEVRRQIWRRGCGRYRDADPWVAALITQHALTVHRESASHAAWADWFSDTESARDELLESLGCELATLETDYSLLRFADLCALAACGASPEAFEHHGVSGRKRDDTLYLDPLPLAGATTFTVACRRIPSRIYRNTTDLGVEMASAHWEKRSVRVAATTP